MLKFTVDHIKDTPVILHFDEPAAMFPLIADMQERSEIAVNGNIAGDISLRREFDRFRVGVRVFADVVLCCSRCLSEYPSVVDTNFTVFYQNNDQTAHAAHDELELNELDVQTSGFSGDEIDLTHEIEEQFVMELPLKPLCNESCKGLCHECGVDLNTNTCSCETNSVSFAFSALKNFKVADN